MFESLTMTETGQFVVGRDRLSERDVVATLGDNNTELKILVKEKLEVGVPRLVTAVRNDLIKACGNANGHPITSGLVHRTFDRMDDAFVTKGTSANGRKTVTQTEIGRNRSAATGGHLVTLSKESGVPLRTPRW